MEVTNQIKVGMKKTVSVLVDEKNTALAMGSGTLPVFATPALVALMEEAAATLAEPLVAAGWSTVGTLMAVEHLAPSPVGIKVEASAEVIAVEGRKIIYTVLAQDAAGVISKGKHERFAIQKEKFLGKAQQRLDDAAK